MVNEILTHTEKQSFGILFYFVIIYFFILPRLLKLSFTERFINRLPKRSLMIWFLVCWLKHIQTLLLGMKQLEILTIVSLNASRV